MTIRTLKMHAAMAVLAAALAPAGASAQEVAPEEETFGTSGETLVSLDAFDFDGMDSSITTGWEPLTNRRYRTAGASPLLTAGLNLPNGAQITKVQITGCDDDAAATLEAALVECPVGGSTCLVQAQVLTANGTPGCGTYTTTLPTPRTVNNSTTTYSAFVGLPATGNTLRFRRVAVYYRLQVSPAPATATFSDVPVGHPLHRFVQALSAAGITGGCGNGAFCPDAPLTRGQMAVFLSTALGLHWPN